MIDLKRVIRSMPDYPKPGIVFRDVTTLMGDGEAFREALEALAAPFAGEGFTKIVGIEARGFVFGAPLAQRLGAGFVPVRKKGKLPYRTLSQSYALEYGTDTVEVHEDAFTEGERVLLVDDLIATGGTALAALELVERAGAKVSACAFVVDLPELGGRAKLEALGQRVHTLVEFEGH